MADTRCCTNSNVSSRQSCVTRTLSGRQTRARSLRSRSTIITFSARSFSFCSSSAPANRSASGRRIRPRVPLIGRVSTTPPASCKNRSGEALAIWNDWQSKYPANGAGIAPPQSQISARRVALAGISSRCARLT